MARRRAAREGLDDDHAAAATWTCRLVVIGSIGIGRFALRLWVAAFGKVGSIRTLPRPRPRPTPTCRTSPRSCGGAQLGVACSVLLHGVPAAEPVSAILRRAGVGRATRMPRGATIRSRLCTALSYRRPALSHCGPLQRDWRLAAFLRLAAASGRRCRFLDCWRG